MVFNFVSHAISIAVGAIYPSFQTIKVIREGSTAMLIKWLKYWTVFSSMLVADTALDALLLSYLIPGYTLLKIALLGWAASPYTNGAEIIFDKFVLPLLESYESDFDAFTSRVISAGQGTVERIWSNVLACTRDAVFSIMWRRESHSLQYQRSVQTPIRTVVEEQDEADVVLDYDNRRIKPEPVDYDEVYFNENETGSIADSDVQPIAMRTRRSGKPRKKIASRTGGRGDLPSNRQVKARGSRARTRKVESDLSD
ncbi:unnamed protein product [Anisakis simplex]|uniref:Receptor expression-enhancing protein n=1 Tax=Anisakis simplex TaxID=6269 RepID=A0A0M3K156_ANISI|nr:unnamed protein product [Anisakis simplex]